MTVQAFTSRPLVVFALQLAALVTATVVTARRVLWGHDMGLTAEVEQSLRDGGACRLLRRARRALSEMAQASYNYANGYVSAIPLELRGG